MKFYQKTDIHIVYVTTQDAVASALQELNSGKEFMDDVLDWLLMHGTHLSGVTSVNDASTHQPTDNPAWFILVLALIFQFYSVDVKQCVFSLK